MKWSLAIAIAMLFCFQVHAKERPLTPQKAWGQQMRAFKEKVKEFKEQRDLLEREMRQQQSDSQDKFYTQKKEMELQESNEIAAMKKEEQKKITRMFSSAGNQQVANFQSLQFSISHSEALIKHKYRKSKRELKKNQEKARWEILEKSSQKIVALAKKMLVYEYPFPDFSNVSKPTKERDIKRYKKMRKRAYKSYVSHSKSHYQYMSLILNRAKTNPVRGKIEYDYDLKTFALEEKNLKNRGEIVRGYLDDVTKNKYTDQQVQEKVRTLSGQLMELQANHRTEKERLRKEASVRVKQVEQENNKAFRKQVEDFETQQIKRTQALS